MAEEQNEDMRAVDLLNDDLTDVSAEGRPVLAGGEVLDVANVVWATGFRQDFDWLKVDTFDERGAPIHQRGVARAPDVYFLGLPWQSRRGSSFLWGVWHDARHIADQIAIQRSYLAYDGRAAVIASAAE